MRGALALFGSTSPSYLILQSLDACNRVLAETYPVGLQRCCARLAALRGELNAAAQAAGCPVPLALDGPGREPLKLTLDAAALGMTGTALADALRGGQLECEYADPRYVVLMFTPATHRRTMRACARCSGSVCTACPQRVGSCSRKSWLGNSWHWHSRRGPIVPSGRQCLPAGAHPGSRRWAAFARCPRCPARRPSPSR